MKLNRKRICEHNKSKRKLKEQYYYAYNEIPKDSVAVQTVAGAYVSVLEIASESNLDIEFAVKYDSMYDWVAEDISVFYVKNDSASIIEDLGCYKAVGVAAIAYAEYNNWRINGFDAYDDEMIAKSVLYSVLDDLDGYYPEAWSWLYKHSNDVVTDELNQEFFALLK